jgi:hypothetical protein
VAVYTFGNSPNDFIEVPDAANPGQARRPVASDAVSVQVRNAQTGADLLSVTPGTLGYLRFTTTDAPVVRVSTDGFLTYKVLVGEEGIQAGVTAAVDASTALANANTAVTIANQALAAVGTGAGGSGTFTGSVDWATQVTNKPSIPTTAAAVGALPASDRGALNGVAPLANGLVPIGNLPVGTATTQVAVGSHTHATTWTSAPAGTYLRVDETSAGVYPAPASTRTDVVRRWRGSIRPTAAQGAQPGDEWVNTGA